MRQFADTVGCRVVCSRAGWLHARWRAGHWRCRRCHYLCHSPACRHPRPGTLQVSQPYPSNL